MLPEKLDKLAAPILTAVLDHPFWTGLRDGSLPGECLAHFVAQDTEHLLPAYARSLARCAATAPADGHTLVLGRSVFGTLEARNRLQQAYAELAAKLDTPPPTPASSPDPVTEAHASFFHAASARSFAAGLGALLPMVWFNFRVSDALLQREPGSRFEPWIDVYHPGEHYRYAVRGFVAMVEEFLATAGEREADELAGHFALGARHEWLFAEGSWRRPSWPV